jgi:D-alanyl-D-alanine carboxypeptidase/D-alanyl-D-alanine-endopeptidase (penicillin-binding protein 4)
MHTRIPGKKNAFIAILAVAFLCFCVAEKAQEVASAVPVATPSEVMDFMEAWHRAEGMEGSLLSLVVAPAGGGESVVLYAPDVSMATASTLKAITTATALGMLGPDFRFETTLSHDGERKPDGVLEGNLYLVGGGDPSLGSADLYATMDFLADKVVQAGIKRIKGHVIGDGSLFTNQLTPDTWAWEDIGNYYGAGASALNIHENLYKLYFKTGAKPGEPTQIVKIEPFMPSLLFTNEVLTGQPGSGDQAYIYGMEYSDRRLVRGTLPPGQSAFEIKGSLPDPAYFAAFALSQALIKKGIAVPNVPQTHLTMATKPAASRTILHQLYSPPLLELATQTNHKSINLYAEAFTRYLGYRFGKEGATKEGNEVIRKYWEQQGLQLKGFFMEDGSGLSRFNAVSARQMTAILQKAYATNGKNKFMETLPVAGQHGTLKNFCKGTQAAGRVAAKSGYIKRVRGYTGYIDTLKGEKLAFTVLVNNYGKSNANLAKDLEQLMNLLVKLG